jgi:hypothetical protein
VADKYWNPEMRPDRVEFYYVRWAEPDFCEEAERHGPFPTYAAARAALERAVGPEAADEREEYGVIEVRVGTIRGILSVRDLFEADPDLVYASDAHSLRWALDAVLVALDDVPDVYLEGWPPDDVEEWCPRIPRAVFRRIETTRNEIEADARRRTVAVVAKILEEAGVDLPGDVIRWRDLRCRPDSVTDEGGDR